LVGLEPSLDSRGLVGVPGGAAAAATAAALEDGRCGAASANSLVLDTMIDRSVIISLYQGRLAPVCAGFRFDVDGSKQRTMRQEPGDRSRRSCQQKLVKGWLIISH